MAGDAPTRIVSFLLLAVCTAFCQQAASSASTLPDAPAPNTNQNATFGSLSDTPRLSVNTLAIPGEGAPHYDPGHFADEIVHKERTPDTPQLSFLGKRPSLHHDLTGNTFLGRVKDAASSMVLTRDEEGRAHLNKSYLLRVMTASVAHSAYRPYWRRSATQPISDFGSTVGSDAGMNVLHAFEPGILQLVKTHEPRFVSSIEEHLSPTTPAPARVHPARAYMKAGAR
jgi:hypothetical protein